MNEEDAILEKLILEGAVEIVGIDPTTEQPLYGFTEKIKTILPELYKDYVNTVNQEIMSLWQKGFLNIDLFDENPLVTLSDNAFYDDKLEELSDEELFFLSEIKRVMSN